MPFSPLPTRKKYSPPSPIQCLLQAALLPLLSDASLLTVLLLPPTPASGRVSDRSIMIVAAAVLACGYARGGRGVFFSFFLSGFFAFSSRLCSAGWICRFRTGLGRFFFLEAKCILDRSSPLLFFFFLLVFPVVITGFIYFFLVVSFFLFLFLFLFFFPSLFSSFVSFFPFFSFFYSQDRQGGGLFSRFDCVQGGWGGALDFFLYILYILGIYILPYRVLPFVSFVFSFFFFSF